MSQTPDLFARRNRFRIAALIVLATLNYMLAVALAAVAVFLAGAYGLSASPQAFLTQQPALEMVVNADE